jgi:hypothetical protein
MDEIKDRQELLLEIEQLKLDNARLGQRMDKMRKWNNSLLQKNWQESEDQTLLEFSEQDSEIPNPQELLQELRIHQEELRVQNEELLEIRYSLEESRSRYQALFRNSPSPMPRPQRVIANSRTQPPGSQPACTSKPRFTS